MIPQFDVEISCRLPVGVEFWVPADEEVAEDEGIGFFRDTWLIYNCSKDLTQSVIQEEIRLLKIADELASTIEEYEAIASRLEHSDPDDATTLPAELKARIPAEVLEGEFKREYSELDGLDLGVAGAVHALSTAGLMTAASCRSHATARSWADRPVIYFASDKSHISTLAPLTEASGCGLGASAPLFYVYSNSVSAMSKLAQLILAHNSEFDGPIFQWEAERERSKVDKPSDPDQLTFPDLG